MVLSLYSHLTPTYINQYDDARPILFYRLSFCLYDNDLTNNGGNNISLTMKGTVNFVFL